MSLRKYHKKRNFKLSPEPYGQKPKKHKKLLYLIQKHAASHLHYDFWLEMYDVFKFWVVSKGIPYEPGVRRLASATEALAGRETTSRPARRFATR